MIQPIPQAVVLPPAFFFLDVAVAVLSPPPMVTVPMTTIPVPLGARERMSPPIVTTPPAVSVWPAMTTLVMGGWLRTDAVASVVAFEHAPLTTTAPPVGARQIVCPSTVAIPPGVKVCEPITRLELASIVKVEEPITTPGLVAVAVVAGGRVITWPLTVIAPPGIKVWPPIMKPEFEFAVMLEPPTTTTAGAAEGVGVEVAPLTITAPPGAMEIV